MTTVLELTETTQGKWNFWLDGQTTNFDGTYKEYLDYCDRTCAYAGGQYSQNIGEFIPIEAASAAQKAKIK